MYIWRVSLTDRFLASHSVVIVATFFFNPFSTKASILLAQFWIVWIFKTLETYGCHLPIQPYSHNPVIINQLHIHVIHLKSNLECTYYWWWIIVWVFEMSVYCLEGTIAGCVRHQPEIFPQRCWFSWCRRCCHDGRGACYLEWLWRDVSYAIWITITTQWPSPYLCTHACCMLGFLTTFWFKLLWTGHLC